MNTSLGDIALFVEVAKHKNFSRASESSGVPVSTLSRHINLLERRIGVKLFNRSTRRVELTEAGSVYFDRCRKIVDEARVAHEQLVEVAQQPKGRLRVSLPASFAIMFMAGMLRDFCAQYPDIECEFDLGIQPVDLMAEPFDLVLRFGHQPDSNVIARRMESIRLGLYASSRYVARHGAPQTPADLVRHQCLRASTSPEDTNWELHAGDRAEVVAVSGRVTANNVGMLHRLCLLGMGIVPLSCRFAQMSTDGAPLVHILPEWQFRPVPLLALFPSRLMPAKTRVFIEFLQTRLLELQSANARQPDDRRAVRTDPQRPDQQPPGT
ncbi:MAG: LysR family transcriptional regulator [Candidimonas sp.]|nr:MAG: LysR family transcriptional regulator [Candidimonas sp.]